MNSPSERDWAQLRALSAETIIEVLGAQRIGEHYRCPRKYCGGLFMVRDDPEHGVNVCCTRGSCVLSSVNWPEWALAYHLDIPVAEARNRLLTHQKSTPIAAPEMPPETRGQQKEEEWVEMFYRIANS